MKVITLEKLTEYIETRHGKQEVTVDELKNQVIIHNIGTDYRESNNIHCTVDLNHVCDLTHSHPFIKSREAEAGALVIDGVVPKFEDLTGFTYKL